MATIVFGAVNGNFSDDTKWIGGVKPGAGDDAQLVLASANCTIDAASACRSLDCNTYTGVLTHNAFTLSIGDGTAGTGNIALRLVAGMTYTLVDATLSAISFISTSATQQSITWAGKTAGNIVFNAASNGSWQFADAFTSGTSAGFTLTKGTLDLNGTTGTFGDIASSSGNTRALTLGAGTTTCRSWSTTTTTGLTFTSTGSTITMSGNSQTFAGGGLTFATVNITGSGNVTINGANTYATFTRTGTAVKTDGLTLSANQTITGTCTLNGNAAINRVLVTSSTLGTAVTLSAATIVTKWCDYRDIAAAGAANWDLTAQVTDSSGDCGGNQTGSAITFTVAATQTATGTASFSWSTHGWTTRVPLPQDDVVISNAFVAGRTVTLDMPRAGKDITFSNTGNSVAWAKTTATTMYGSLIMTGTSLMTNSGTTAFTFEGRSATFGFTSAGQTFTNPITVQTISGTLQLQDAFLSSSTGTLKNGTWDFNNFSSTFTTFNSNNSNVRTLTLGSATQTITGLSYNINQETNLTVTATTGTIKLTDATTGSLAFNGATGKTFGNVWFARGASTGTITIDKSSTFTDFKDSGTAAHSLLFTTGITTTVTTFTISNGTTVFTINSTTTGTHALVKAGGGTISCDYLNIQHSVATPATTWYAGEHSTDNQAVATAGSGWTFTLPPEVLFGKWQSSMPAIIPRLKRVVGNDGSSLNPMQISGAVEDVTSDKWGPQYPVQLDRPVFPTSAQAAFAPPFEDKSVTTLPWVPKFPDYVWKAPKSADFPAFFQPAPKDLSIIAMDWMSNVPGFIWRAARSAEYPGVSHIYPGTRLYFPSATKTVAISPSPDAAWDNTSSFIRTTTSTVHPGIGLSTIAFSDSDDTDMDILVRQYISPQLVSGQTIHGSQVIKAQFKCRELAVSSNIFLTLGIRVIAADGTTVRKTVVPVTRDDVEFDGVGANRQFTATSTDTDYTTVDGDRLVIEIGAGGDPDVGSDHDFQIVLGNSVIGSDLPEDDSTTSSLNPWVQLSDQLVFAGEDPLFISRLPTYPGATWALAKQRLVEYQAFFQPALDDALLKMMLWLPRFPDRIDKLPPLRIPGGTAPMWQPEVIYSSFWQNYLPDYVWRNRLKTSNAWYHPAFQAQLFTGSDFLHAEWYSSPSLSGRWDISPSLLAEFEALASMGDQQATNP